MSPDLIYSVGESIWAMGPAGQVQLCEVGQGSEPQQFNFTYKRKRSEKSLLIALNGVFSGKAMVQLIIFGKFSLTFLYLKIIFLSPINM